MDKQFLSPAEVVARWNGAVTVGTLTNWRCQKKGPPYKKLGGRVRYDVQQLAEWEAANSYGETTGKDGKK